MKIYEFPNGGCSCHQVCKICGALEPLGGVCQECGWVCEKCNQNSMFKYYNINFSRTRGGGESIVVKAESEEDGIKQLVSEYSDVCFINNVFETTEDDYNEYVAIKQRREEHARTFEKWNSLLKKYQTQ